MDDQQGSGFCQGLDKPEAETTEARLDNCEDAGESRATDSAGAGPAPGARPDAAAAAVGVLAHDFSNVAVSIISAANLLQRFSDDPARVMQIAQLLRETGERAIAISRRLPPLPEPPSSRVLFVEDDPNVRAAFGRILAAAGFYVTPALDGEEALRRCSQGERFDLVIAGDALPRMDGLTLVRRLREVQAALPAIVVTGHDAGADRLALQGAALENVTVFARSAGGEDLAARAASLVG